MAEQAENNKQNNAQIIEEMQSSLSNSAELPEINASNKTTRKLLTIPSLPTPVVPVGIGEMMRASKVEISALDTYLSNCHAILELTDDDTDKLKKVAALRYEKQANRTNKKLGSSCISNLIATKSQAPIDQVQATIEDALNTPISEINKINKKKILSNSAINELEYRKEQLVPFAERYIKKLGYQTIEGEAEKVLKETIDFYSKSPTLANTLRNLVSTLEAQNSEQATNQ